MYQHILVPLDNSPIDGTILEHIRGLARFAKSRITLIHVADGHVARNQAQLNLSDSEEIKLDRAYLDRVAGELKAEGFDVNCVLEMGEPSVKILELAERDRCDLIAMATHGHGIIGDVILGSVADKIRHRTTIPVLMIKGRKD